MLLEKFIKQPAEVKDYNVDYSKWLTPISDAIASYTTAVTCPAFPADTSLTINSVVASSNGLKLWIGGGTSGRTYKITIRITTTGGRIDESELLFIVRDF